jgi:hypothetical protein
MFEFPSQKDTKKLSVTLAYAKDKFGNASLAKLKAAV